MIKNPIIALLVISLLVNCSSTKPSNTVAHKNTSVKPAANSATTTPKKNDIKFLDQISSNPQLANQIPDVKSEEKETSSAIIQTKTAGNSVSSANLTAIQLKYATLLGTDASQVQITDLLKSVDEWYGTRYKMGGESKSGIDCSAFVQTIYSSAFGMSVPRTAVEQYKVCNHISATEMKEGDLVFFNTAGGVSHVGIYLRNNKFIHASVARGVTVSDLFDPYYLRRFLGVGRIEKSLGTR